MTQTIRLGDLLVRAGVVNEQQLNAALGEQKKWGGRLGTILVRMGALSEDLLVKALSKQLGIPRANLDAAQVPPQILERLDKATCEKYNVVPLQYVQDRRALMMGVSDPFHVVAMDDLSRRVGLRIEPYLAGETAIAHTIARLYGGVTSLEQAKPLEEEPLKLVGNDGMTLRKSMTEIEADHRAKQAARAAASMAPTPAPQATTQFPTGGWPLTTPPQAAPSSFQTGGWPRTTPPQQAGGTTPPQGAEAQTLDELDRLAKRQAKALRAILELLIEKGVLSREEYLAWVNAR
jgi:hypothetical protein